MHSLLFQNTTKSSLIEKASGTTSFISSQIFIWDIPSSIFLLSSSFVCIPFPAYLSCLPYIHVELISFTSVLTLIFLLSPSRPLEPLFKFKILVIWSFIFSCPPLPKNSFSGSLHTSSSEFRNNKIQSYPLKQNSILNPHSSQPSVQDHGPVQWNPITLAATMSLQDVKKVLVQLGPILSDCLITSVAQLKTKHSL